LKGRWLSITLSGVLLMLTTIGYGGPAASTALQQFNQPRLVAQLGHSLSITSVAFSPDGCYVLTGSANKTARLWDIETGKEVRMFEGHEARITSVAFSPDGRYVLTGSGDNTARLWDRETGKEVRKFEGHAAWITSVAFSPDGRYVLTGSWDSTTRLWDAATGRELASMISFRDGTWAVVDPEGRFDASNGGDVEGLHWVVADEPIALSQLKERYYEPGLLAKVMGFNKEPLRDVKAFKNVALYPAIELRKPEGEHPKLGIKLTNRGGGIGKVVVFINGKEIAADARGEKIAPDAKSAELSVDTKNHPYLVPGKKNLIEVKAYNAEGYLSSRGVVVDYDAPGIAPSEMPTLWAIVSGISDYKGTAIDLGYAAKDAVDVANAVRLGASRLLGADRVQISLLTTEPVSGAAEPTKKILIEAFTKARKAKSTDILLVYLSGHGVTYGGAEGDYYYLTRDAMTADLSDPAVRDAVALSSSELSELIRAIPATKQVLVLDTCGAGKAVEALSAKREISSSHIRALERMKDRFGLFILGGATADKVSYEASRFGQGLLTYSLLVGMQKGPALKEERFIDVDTLFNYAVESVPAMAKDIGGIQQPIKAVPKGGATFDLGELTREDRDQIKVASPKPFVLRSIFQDAESFRDHLALAQRVNDQLRTVSSRGREAAVIFVDADDAPDAYSLVGRYQCRNEDVTADVRVFKGTKEVGRYTEHGKKGEADKLADNIVLRAQETIRQQPR
jgi:WD domain, G-beta repeat/Caspase domain